MACAFCRPRSFSGCHSPLACVLGIPEVLGMNAPHGQPSIMIDRSRCINSPPPSPSTLAPVGTPWIKLSVACLIMDLLLAALFFLSLPHSSLGVSRDHLLRQPLALWPLAQGLLGRTHTKTQSVGEGGHTVKREECHKRYKRLQVTILLLNFLCDTQSPLS